MNVNMNSAVLALLALVTPVASQHHNNGMIHRRNIWGEPAQCSDHLSIGPPNADVQIRLGGLPPSTASAPVHLQWWAPRKSPTNYSVLSSPVNCSVYDNMLFALPRYTDSDFNGGNVRVSQNGEAVIRIGSPSTFFMYGRVAIPYIDLRVCTGEANIQHARTVLLFAGPYRWISPKGSSITILQSSRVTPQAAVASSALVPPRAVIVGVVGFGLSDTTTTMLMEATTTSLQPTDRDVMLSEARDKFDLSALRVSPVYACFLEEKFFDHFTEDCAEECGQDSAVAHGQCVRAETPDPPTSLSLSWHLTLDCGSACWAEAKNASLHSARLAMASHLDIPFQEVSVSVRFSSASGRRLADSVDATLGMSVDTSRLSPSDASELMTSFGQDAAAMTEVLGIEVLSVTVAVPVPTSSPADDNLDQGSDPYVPAYDELEQGLDRRPATNSMLDLLPTEAIIAIAVGVVILAAGFAFMVIRTRRRQRKEQEAALQAQVKADKIEAVIEGGNEVTAFDGSWSVPPAPKQAW